MFGSATKDGKLYHGRVLDYMTTIGLQDAATTFIVKPRNHLAFANVGYAAFIGSVSGMNVKAVSLGEPESIEFIKPGQGHERIGEGIADAVVLSAGSRLETLRERVTAKHGKIDAEIGMWLMSRPVAMQSNLHNVLFVPPMGFCMWPTPVTRSQRPKCHT